MNNELYNYFGSVEIYASPQQILQVLDVMFPDEECISRLREVQSLSIRPKTSAFSLNNGFKDVYFECVEVSDLVTELKYAYSTIKGKRLVSILGYFYAAVLLILGIAIYVSLQNTATFIALLILAGIGIGLCVLVSKSNSPASQEKRFKKAYFARLEKLLKIVQENGQ